MKQKRSHNEGAPGWAIRFFYWYCNDHLCEAVMGDMLELYRRRRSVLGKRRADLLFIFNVLHFLQPFAIRKRSHSTINHIAMFKNYFIIAWRTMSRQKMYTAIKIGGFALGLATCMIIFLFIRHEISYDKYYTDTNRLFRMYNQYNGGDDIGNWTSFPAPVAQILRTDFPDIEKAGRLIPYNWYNAGNNLFRRQDQIESTYEEGFAYADPEIIDILQIPLVYGNPRHALDQPNTIVISKRKADKYFAGEDPVGKTIILNEDKSRPYTIGGVMKEFPVNSHLQYDFLITLTQEEFWKGEQTSWCCWNYNIYLRLRPDANPAQLEQKLLSLRDTHYIGYLKEMGDKSLEDVRKYHSFRLQPVSDIYLQEEAIWDNLRHGDVRYVWLFGGVAFFILALACINFINLSTAKSANRAKEVGLRKVVGSVRGYLVRQFLTESVLYSLVSFALAIIIVCLAMPYFNGLAGRTLSIPWSAWWLFPLLLLSVLVIGFMAGIYPSFYLSAFKPIDVLKGSISRGTRNSKMRSVMVVFQFTTSIILVIGTFIIYRQMNYILNTKVGFDKEQVIMVQGANTLPNQKTFKDELMKLPGVEAVTLSSYLPVEGTKRDQNSFWREGKSKEEKSIGAQKWYVDEDFIGTMGMKLVAGRNFMQEMASDSQSIIINEAMAKEFGFKNPVGERIMTWEVFTVIGVVEDFNFESMKGEIGPLAFVRGGWGSIAAVKVKTEDMAGMITQVASVWDRVMPHQPIRYTFLDESYARMYDDVQRMGRIFASFAVLAIVVACLGLFALSAFMVEQRNKEISIRLVLGASVNSIFRLLTQNFVMLVLISFVVAAPLAWYLMQEWLKDYAYRIDITWDVFALSGLLSVLVALVTVSYQSVRAAMVNPATRLRSE